MAGVCAWKADCGSEKKGSSSSELTVCCRFNDAKCWWYWSELPIDDADVSLRADTADTLRPEGILRADETDGDFERDIADI